MKESRILGIDPGLQITGYCVLESTEQGARIQEAGIIRSAERPALTDLTVRLKAIHDAVLEILDQWKPNVIAVEQLYAHYEHPRTAILMGHARGIFFLCGGLRDIPVISYPATRIKKTITGSGRASKEQMQMAIQRELRLTKMPEPHDVADAVGIALCHYYLSSSVTRSPGSAVFTGVNMAAFRQEADNEEEPEEDENA